MSSIPVLFVACFVVSVAHGSGWCNEPSFQKYSINSPLLFSCDDSQLRNEIASLQQKVDRLIEALLPALGTQSNPASSCSEITTRSVDGTYWLSSGTQDEPVQVTCDFDVQLPPLSPVSGWQEIANIDLSDPSQSCPPPWRETLFGSSRRCERASTTNGCESVFFPTSGVPFTKLCGKAIGYATGSVDAFFSIFGLCSGISCGINDPYLDGISFTYGPEGNRTHIWSQGAHTDSAFRCPCGTDGDFSSPDFVGENYYCETFVTPGVSVLWEGEGCADVIANEAACCANPNLPWFCREFDEPVTTDNIEVRLCTDEPDEDIDLEMLSLFIQ